MQVVEADHARVAKGRSTQIRRPRNLHVFERAARDPRDSVTQARNALLVELVEKEGAELRTRHAGAGVDNGLHHFAQIEFSRDRSGDFVQALGDRIFLLQRLLFLAALGHVVEYHNRANDLRPPDS